MGKVYTTSEDLTSVANAIRAKSGSNSSLVYPSGFVSEIGNITSDICDGFGANPEFLQTIWNETITLADTNFDNITVSNSTQTIYDRVRIVNDAEDTNILLNWDYDYILLGEGKINCNYLEDITPALIASYQLFTYPITTYNTSLYLISSASETAAGVESGVSSSLIFYKNSYNTDTLSLTNSGLTYAISVSPSVGFNSGLYSVYTPVIRVYIDNAVLPKATYDVIDKNNTTFSFSWKLYRYKKHSTIKAKKQLILENRFLTDYPQYAPQQS